MAEPADGDAARRRGAPRPRRLRRARADRRARGAGRRRPLGARRRPPRRGARASSTSSPAAGAATPCGSARRRGVSLAGTLPRARARRRARSSTSSSSASRRSSTASASSSATRSDVRASEHLTRKQYEELQGELAELEAKRPAIVQAIKTAREFGDLSENFEYHAAKNEQGLLEARIRTLKHRVDTAEIVEVGDDAGRLRRLGRRVRRPDRARLMTIEISNVTKPGAVSPTAPLGAALMGAREGDEVEVSAPRGAWTATRRLDPRRVAGAPTPRAAPQPVSAARTAKTAPVPAATRNLGRLSEIAQVAVRHGFGYVFERHRLTDLLPRQRGGDAERRDGAGSARGQHLREMLDELGPTFVKFGQLLSTRPDVVPPDIIAELRGLQDDVRAVPVRRRRARDPRGARPADRAALPRVRRAAARGRVDRPGAPRGAAERPPRRRQGAAAATRRGRSRPTSRCSTRRRGSRRSACARSTSSTPSEIVDEFARSIRQELDYRLEARNAEAFHRNFAGHPHVARPARLLELHARARADARVPRRRSQLGDLDVLDAGRSRSAAGSRT